MSTMHLHGTVTFPSNGVRIGSALDMVDGDNAHFQAVLSALPAGPWHVATRRNGDDGLTDPVAEIRLAMTPALASAPWEYDPCGESGRHAGKRLERLSDGRVYASDLLVADARVRPLPADAEAGPTGVNVGRGTVCAAMDSSNGFTVLGLRDAQGVVVAFAVELEYDEAAFCPHCADRIAHGVCAACTEAEPAEDSAEDLAVAPDA